MSNSSLPLHRSLQYVLYVKWYGFTLRSPSSKKYGRGHGSHEVIAIAGGAFRFLGASEPIGASITASAIQGCRRDVRRARYARTRCEGASGGFLAATISNQEVQ